MSRPLALVILFPCIEKTHTFVKGPISVTVIWCCYVPVPYSFLPVKIADFPMQILANSAMPGFIYIGCLCHETCKMFICFWIVITESTFWANSHVHQK